MSNYRFLFDLDATITRIEILPEIAREINRGDEMKALTERTMTGEIPFQQSFVERVNILSEIPVSQVRKLVSEIPVHEKLVEFIREHGEDCYVVTGNLDVWIEGLMERIGILPGHVYCSHVTVADDRIIALDSIIDKGKVIAQFERPFVAVGDGNNDAEMVGAADIGIGFGGVRTVAASVMQNAMYVVNSEETLCQFLRRL